MRRIISKNWLRLLLVFMISFGISLTVASAIRIAVFPQKTAEANIEDSTEPVVATLLPDFIDLQPVFDDWLRALPQRAKLSFVLYDLDNQQPAIIYNQEENYPSNLLHELLLVYDAYRQIDLGTDSPNTPITNEYVNGELVEYNLANCLDLITRGIDNSCSNVLENDAERIARVNQLAESLDFTDAQANDNYVATAQSLTDFLNFLWKHDDLSLENWANFQNSLLKQTNSSLDENSFTENFKNARIYAKQQTSNTTYFEETGFIEFVASNRHYTFVIFANNLISLDDLSTLANSLEEQTLNVKNIPQAP